jgi:hypothetical protein
VLCETLKSAGDAERSRVFSLVLDALPRIAELVDRAHVISLLVPYAEDQGLRDRLGDEALDALVGAGKESPTFERGEPIRKSLDISNWERYRANTLLALVPFLNERLLHKALDFARSVGYPSLWSRCSWRSADTLHLGFDMQ